MPTLLLFAPCERVLSDQGDNSVSLITLLTGISASLPFPAEQPIPENTVVPIRWSLLALWKASADDSAKQFGQRIVLESPSGKVLLTANAEFVFTKPIVRTVVQFTSFPLTEFGEYRVRLELQESEGANWKEITTFPFEVQRGPVIDLAKRIADPDGGQAQ